MISSLKRGVPPCLSGCHYKLYHRRREFSIAIWIQFIALLESRARSWHNKQKIARASRLWRSGILNTKASANTINESNSMIWRFLTPGDRKKHPIKIRCFGGEAEIRTLETLLRPTRFPVVRPRPTRRLLHWSITFILYHMWGGLSRGF